MSKPISPGLKTLFLVHFILGLIFGLINLLIPEAWTTVFGIPVPDPTAYRVVGAAILGFSSGSLWAYGAKTWDQVKILVQTELVWPSLGALAWLWGLLFAGLPPAGWPNFIILAGFAIAFWVFYNQHESASAVAAEGALRKAATKAAPRHRGR